MSGSLLSRYLRPEVLTRIARQQMEPRDLVIGNLAGGHKSPLSGFAVEFAGHREYVWGDDPKHIDWRLYFTRDKYFIKQYEMETNFVCHLLLDVSASMRYGEGDEQKLMYAAQLASMLGYGVVGQSDKVSMGTFDDKVRGFLSPSNSMAQIVRMAGHLAQIDPVEKSQMDQCLSEFCGRMGRREIVMIFSDFFTDLDALEVALQRMRFNHHEVVLFQVLHHDERAFEFDGSVKFVGLETPAELLTQPQELRDGYLAAMRKFQAQLAQCCQRNRIELLEIDTRRNMGELLLDYLNHRKVRRKAR